MSEAIDLQVELFAAEIEMVEANQSGEPSAAKIAEWMRLSIRTYDAEQLLESLHRHVKLMTEAKEGFCYDFHLEMVNFLTDEIDTRREENSE